MIEKEDIRKDIGSYIKNLREKYRMSQKDLAFHLNITRQAVSEWERGISCPSYTTLFNLSKVFNVPMDSFLKNSKKTLSHENLFRTKWWLKPICEFLTNHHYRELVLWDEDFEKRGCKYPERSDFYYKCKICGYLFFNHHVSKEDIDKIKKIRNRKGW